MPYTIPEKKCPLKPKPFKSKEYLQWAHNSDQRCIVCGSMKVEAHHLLAGSLGRPDDKIVMLCPEHHRGKFSPHGFDSDMFYEDYPKEFLEEQADIMFKEFEDSYF